MADVPVMAGNGRGVPDLAGATPASDKTGPSQPEEAPAKEAPSTQPEGDWDPSWEDITYWMKTHRKDLKAAMISGMQLLSVKERANVAGILGYRTWSWETDSFVWRAVIVTMCIVLILSALMLGCVAVFVKVDQHQLPVVQVVLTVFTSAVSFISGLLIPNPTRQGHTGNNADEQTGAHHHPGNGKRH